MKHKCLPNEKEIAGQARNDRYFCKKFILIAVILLGMFTKGNAQLVLTMEKAMDIAQQNSPAIRTSLMNLERYQQMLIAQRASLKSRLSLNLSPVDYSKTRRFDNRLSQWYTNETFSSSGIFQIDQPILLTDGVISLINRFAWQNNNSQMEGLENSNQAFSNDLYLQLTQPIFTYNRRKMELKQLEFDLENAYISYALQRLNTEKQITNQFYSVYIAQSNLEISKEELTNAQQSYEIIKSKVEADLAPRDELFQAELNLAKSRSSLEEQIVSMENDKDRLKQTLGLDLNTALSVVTNIDVNSVAVDQNEAISYALNSRLELRQREIESEQLDFEMIQTKAMNEFKGDISLSLGLTGDNRDINRMYNNPTQNPRIAISFSVPIFDWGEKKARVRAQEISQKIHESDVHENKLDIMLSIRQTCRSLQNLKTQIGIAEQNIANAQRTYDLNLTRYREGDITGMDMNQYQTQLSNTKIAYTQALINYKIELLNLKILSLYDFEKNTAIVPLKDFTNK
jgi:outer membrane protein TolC